MMMEQASYLHKPLWEHTLVRVVSARGCCYYSPHTQKVLSTCNFRCDELTIPWYDSAKFGGLRRALRIFEQDDQNRRGSIVCEPANLDTDQHDDLKNANKGVGGEREASPPKVDVESVETEAHACRVVKVNLKRIAKSNQLQQLKEVKANPAVEASLSNKRTIMLGVGMWLAPLRS